MLQNNHIKQVNVTNKMYLSNLKRTKIEVYMFFLFVQVLFVPIFQLKLIINVTSNLKYL